MSSPVEEQFGSVTWELSGQGGDRGRQAPELCLPLAGGAGCVGPALHLAGRFQKQPSASRRPAGSRPGASAALRAADPVTPWKAVASFWDAGDA